MQREGTVEEIERPGPIQVAGADALALAARGVARRWFPALAFADGRAEDMLARIDLDAARFDAVKLEASIMRTMVFDAIARSFFRRHPEGLGIGFFSGMCTRFSRIDNGAMRWVDVETAPVARFVAESQPANERHRVTSACSIACSGWMRRLEDAGDIPALIVVQGGLVGAPRSAVEAFFLSASRWCRPGVEIVCDFDGRAPLQTRRPGASVEVLDDTNAWSRFPRLRSLRDCGAPVIKHLRVCG